jgi:hypothetical protein
MADQFLVLFRVLAISWHPTDLFAGEVSCRANGMGQAITLRRRKASSLPEFQRARSFGELRREAVNNYWARRPRR